MERLAARAVAEETFVVLQLQVIAVDFHGRQNLGPMGAECPSYQNVGHECPPIPADNVPRHSIVSPDGRGRGNCWLFCLFALFLDSANPSRHKHRACELSGSLEFVLRCWYVLRRPKHQPIRLNKKPGQATPCGRPEPRNTNTRDKCS